jgi:hypothetical protein
VAEQTAVIREVIASRGCRDKLAGASETADH